MKPERGCGARNQQGQPCRQPPLRDGDFCFWHDPEHADAAADARRLGGQRRRREGTLSGAYEFKGLESPEDLKRILEIAAYDALALENSVSRIRTLIALVQVGVRVIEVTELADRITAIEIVVEPRLEVAAGSGR